MQKFAAVRRASLNDEIGLVRFLGVVRRPDQLLEDIAVVQVEIMAMTVKIFGMAKM